MTTKQYWPIALDHFLNAPESTYVNNLPEIEGIPNEFLKIIIRELETDCLISVWIGGGIKVEDKGKDYLERNKLGLTQKKETPLINLHNVGNTYANIQDSVLNNDTNLDKSKIAIVQQTKPKKKSTKGIVIVIVAILTLLIAGLTFWLEHIKVASK